MISVDNEGGQMAVIDGHYASCEKAESHACACGVCGGAWHGWTGAVKLARDADPQGRQELRRTADNRWRNAFEKCKTVGRATFPKKAASMDSVIADIVDLLAEGDQQHVRGNSRRDRDDRNATSPAARVVPLQEHANQRRTPHGVSEGLSGVYFDDDQARYEQGLSGDGAVSPENQTPAPGSGDPEYSLPSGQRLGRPRSIDELRKIMGSGSTLDQVEALGAVTFERALDEVGKQLGGPVPHEVKKALSDHFWCDFLANTAKYLATINRFAGLIPNRIAKWVSNRIIEWRQDQNRIPLEDAVIRTATKSMCKTLLELTKTVDTRSVLLVVRILAILICKSPERHKAVTEYCVDPVCKQLTAETKRRLTTVIEKEWLPALHEDVKQSMRGGTVGHVLPDPP